MRKIIKKLIAIFLVTLFAGQGTAWCAGAALRPLAAGERDRNRPEEILLLTTPQEGDVIVNVESGAVRVVERIGTRNVYCRRIGTDGDVFTRSAIGENDAVDMAKLRLACRQGVRVILREGVPGASVSVTVTGRSGDLVCSIPGEFVYRCARLDLNAKSIVQEALRWNEQSAKKEFTPGYGMSAVLMLEEEGETLKHTLQHIAKMPSIITSCRQALERNPQRADADVIRRDLQSVEKALTPEGIENTRSDIAAHITMSVARKINRLLFRDSVSPAGPGTVSRPGVPERSVLRPAAYADRQGATPLRKYTREELAETIGDPEARRAFDLIADDPVLANVYTAAAFFLARKVRGTEPALAKCVWYRNARYQYNREFMGEFVEAYAVERGVSFSRIIALNVEGFKGGEIDFVLEVDRLKYAENTTGVSQLPDGLYLGESKTEELSTDLGVVIEQAAHTKRMSLAKNAVMMEYAGYRNIQGMILALGGEAVVSEGNTTFTLLAHQADDQTFLAPGFLPLYVAYIPDAVMIRQGGKLFLRERVFVDGLIDDVGKAGKVPLRNLEEFRRILGDAVKTCGRTRVTTIIRNALRNAGAGHAPRAEQTLGQWVRVFHALAETVAKDQSGDGSRREPGPVSVPASSAAESAVLRPVATMERVGLSETAYNIECEVRRIDPAHRNRRAWDAATPNPMVEYILKLDEEGRRRAAALLVSLAEDHFFWGPCFRNHDITHDIYMLCRADQSFMDIFARVIARYAAEDHLSAVRRAVLTEIFGKLYIFWDSHAHPISFSKMLLRHIDRETVVRHLRLGSDTFKFTYHMPLGSFSNFVLCKAFGEGNYFIEHGQQREKTCVGVVQAVRKEDGGILALSVDIFDTHQGYGTEIMKWAVVEAGPGNSIVSLYPATPEEVRFYTSCQRRGILSRVMFGYDVASEMSSATIADRVAWHEVRGSAGEQPLAVAGQNLFVRAWGSPIGDISKTADTGDSCL